MPSNIKRYKVKYHQLKTILFCLRDLFKDIIRMRSLDIVRPLVLKYMYQRFVIGIRFDLNHINCIELHLKVELVSS